MAQPIQYPMSQDKPSPISQFVNTSGPMSSGYAPPITNTDPSGPTNFSQTSLAQGIYSGDPTSMNSSGMQSPVPEPSQGIAMPIGYMQQQSSPSQAPKDPGMSPADRMGASAGGAAMAGLNAGSSVQPTTDTGSALLQVGGATLGGAATGAMIGSAAGGIGAVPGAAIGGLVGLVSSGINAWVGTNAARAQARKNEKINTAMLARQKAAADQQQANFETTRQDKLKQQALNNQTVANQSQWTAMDKARQSMNDMFAQDVNFKNSLLDRLR